MGRLQFHDGHLERYDGYDAEERIPPGSSAILIQAVKVFYLRKSCALLTASSFSRFDYVDYVFPAGSYRLGLVVRNPHLEDLSYLTFKNVLRDESWQMVVVAALTMAVLLMSKKNSVNCKNMSLPCYHS